MLKMNSLDMNNASYVTSFTIHNSDFTFMIIYKCSAIQFLYITQNI